MQSLQLSTLKKYKAKLDREIEQRINAVDTLRMDQFESVEKKRLFPDALQSEDDRIMLTSVHPLPINPMTQNEPSLEFMPKPESSELIKVKVTQSDVLIESS